MKIENLFKEFIIINASDELEIIETYNFNLDEIAEIDRGTESEIDDSLGFGESITLLSNVSAFIFFIIAEKVVERGIEVSKAKLLEVLLENKEKIVKLSKERYDIDVESVVSKIIYFLEDKK